jgi:uncharacterized RDD family membrane protein YckC
MSEESILVDQEQEKRTNKRLAIGVGVLGLGAFSFFYILFFLMMFLKPGLIFSMMPDQSFTTAALSDNNRTYILSEKLDMSELSIKEKREPKKKYILSVLEGTTLAKPQEIPAYESAIGSDNKLIFFSDGMYRTYDGNAWTEKRTDSIGHDPQGIETPYGLYIISTFEEKPRLTRIMNDEVVIIPLPDEYMRAQKETKCPCTQLVWYQGRLCLFWSTNSDIAWTSWNNATWAPVATSPYSGGFQVIVDGQKLYFFNREGINKNRSLSYYVFENNDWSGPMRLPIKSTFIHWDVFMQHGKLMLFLQEPLSQTLYTIDNDTLANPIHLKSNFNILGMIGRIAAIAIFGNLAVFLSIFGVSALMRKYKNRYWTEHETQYEFASLFRRFIAYLIDNFVLIIPPAIVMGLFMAGQDVSKNPVRAVLMIMSLFVFYFLGGFLYNSLLEGLLGATLGKKICGIKVLKADFTPCGLSAGFLRNLMRIVDCFFYYLVAAVAMSGTLKWQRLGDLVAETVVVKKKKIDVPEKQLHEESMAIPEE